MPTHPPPSIMFSADLAAEAKRLREAQGLTQAAVARRIAERADSRSCSRQAVSQAEDAEVGSNMDGLRVKIIEELSSRRIVGPGYFFALG